MFGLSTELVTEGKLSYRKREQEILIEVFKNDNL